MSTCVTGRARRRAVLAAAALLVVARPGAGAPPPADEDIPDAVVQKVDPSVVAIQHERAVGSGFIVTTNGYILTNGHVVRGDDPEDPTEPAKSVTVILNDERKFPAQVLGFCMNPDVAVIKVESPAPLAPVEFGDSRRVQIGQKVFAVGTPVGLKRTFTSGILSNVDRTDLDTFTKVFQTDAAINPGNSGGPLFDHEGRVLGLNTYATSGNNLGFTIPIHVAEVLYRHIREHGRFVRSDVPVFFGSELYDEMRAALGVDRGVLVDYVMEGTPAWAAGLRAGDVITAQNGEPCSARTKAELLDLAWAFTILPPGTPVTWTVRRPEGAGPREWTARVVTEEAEPEPDTGRFPGEIRTEKYEALGLSYLPIVRLHRLLLRLTDAPGVLVEDAAKGTPADKAGLESNDIITHVNDVAVTNAVAFRQAMEARLAQREKYIDLTLQRRLMTIHTALAPYYGLGGKHVVVVQPPGRPRYLELVLRELVAEGARLTLAPLGEPEPVSVAPVTVTALAGVPAGTIDVLLLLDGENAEQLWTDEAVRTTVRAVHAADGMLAAVGSSVIALLAAEPALQGRKITTRKADSAAAVQRKAQYTGSEVEKDGKLLTTTGFDRRTVRRFLKELGKAGPAAEAP